jgi:hypothetical protein
MKAKELLEIEIENIKTKEKKKLKDVVDELGLKDYFERKKHLELNWKEKEFINKKLTEKDYSSISFEDEIYSFLLWHI